MQASNSKIKSFIKSKKINVFLLFLVLSFSILVLTKLSKNYTNTITFNINKINVPEAHIVINDTNNKLNITLKTFGFKFLRYYFKRPSLNIDFENDMYKNDTVYIWNRRSGYSKLNAQFDKNVEIVTINPDTLFFRYGVHTIKKVAIKINTDIKFSPGFDLFGNYSIEPDSVRIIGPDVLISEINEIVTDTFKIDQINSDITQALALKLPENNEDLIFSTEIVMLKGRVEKFTEGVLKIPVEVKNVPDAIKIKYFPRVVNVSYYTSLVDFDAISEKDFRVVCDYNKLTNDVSFLIPEIKKSPDNVKNVKIDQKRIEFIITE